MSGCSTPGCNPTATKPSEVKKHKVTNIHKRMVARHKNGAPVKRLIEEEQHDNMRPSPQMRTVVISTSVG
jgi:hypothetical protein